MGRTPLPKDEALQPLNVKVPSEDLYFVQEILKPALGVSYNAEAVREVLVQLRTCFRLPQYVVDVLEAEMKAKKLNILGYVQELLLRALRGPPRQHDPGSEEQAGGGPEGSLGRRTPRGLEIPDGSSRVRNGSFGPGVRLPKRSRSAVPGSTPKPGRASFRSLRRRRSAAFRPRGGAAIR